MEKDELSNIWQKGNDHLLKDKKIDKEMITNYLSEKTLKTSKLFVFNIVFYCCIQLASIILLSMNLAGYMNNRVMIWILIVQLMVSMGILLYGIHIFYRLRIINNYSDTLSNMIDKQLLFFRTHYEIWLVITSFSVLILIFAVNIFVDNDNGQYLIYNKMKYSMINLILFLFIYGTQKLSGFIQLRNLKAYLSDLRNGILDVSIGREKNMKKYQWVWILIAIIFTISLIAGILKFLQFQ
ncbi:hypothetical protein ACFL6I_12190 [candidate division KSB1 bacterium]